MRSEEKHCQTSQLRFLKKHRVNKKTYFCVTKIEIFQKSNFLENDKNNKFLENDKTSFSKMSKITYRLSREEKKNKFTANVYLDFRVLENLVFFRMRMFVCVCVCVRERERFFGHFHIKRVKAWQYIETKNDIYKYIYSP